MRHPTTLFLHSLPPPCTDPPRDPEDKNEVLSWSAVQEKVPWGIVLLLGGGFAMAEGSKQSGLSDWLGEQLYIFNNVNSGVIVLIVTLLTAMLTEVASNSATASIILPVLNQLVSFFFYLRLSSFDIFFLCV